MANWDSLLTKVYVAPTIVTPFTWSLVGGIRGFDHTDGNEGETRQRVFGQAAAIVKAGSPNSEYSFDMLYDPTDTNGQVVLRAAKASQADVEIAIVNGATAGAEEGWHETVKVTEFTVSDEADGSFAEGSLSLIGDTAKTTFTGGKPV